MVHGDLTDPATVERIVQEINARYESVLQTHFLRAGE
jgi:hypothetical protein